MADFGKLNFAVSFNPQTAFPLDARSCFTSLEEAESAAAGAVEIGSSEGTYYFGETIAVVENDAAALYQIQPDGSLSAVGEVDLSGYATQTYVAEQIAAALTSGTVDLSAYSTTEEVEALISTAIAAVDLSAYQTEEEVQALIDTAIAAIDLSTYQTADQVAAAITEAIEAAGHVTMQIVDTLPDAADAEENVLYLALNAETGYYDLYALADGSLVQIDDTTVDLSAYSTTEEVQAMIDSIDLSAYQTADDVAAAIAEALSDTSNYATDEEVSEMLTEVFG